MPCNFEDWYDLERDRLIQQFTEENPDVIRTDEDGQDIENNQRFIDWTEEEYENYDWEKTQKHELDVEDFCEIQSKEV